jgi:hypothetical protein
MKTIRTLAIVAAISGLIVSAYGLQAAESGSSVIFANRVYRIASASQVEWMELKLLSRQPVVLSDSEKDRCAEKKPAAIPGKTQSMAEASMKGNGKLLTWSADGTMFAYVAHDGSIPDLGPNRGCADCFYPLLKIARTSDAAVQTTIRLPKFSEHWNFAESMLWSPDSKTILVGAEAGISTAHYEDYWLLDWKTQSWRYAGGGNDAKWSPDSSQLLWSTPRDLVRLGKIGVWVVHLVRVDVTTLKQEPLTSGTAYVSDFAWCSN